MAESIASFYCGTSNVVLPVASKAFFPASYRERSRLSYYSSLFNSVEVNSTFYKLPMPRTVEKWAGEVPDDFRFTFKLWREITHAKELIYEVKDVGRFMNIVNQIGGKKGSLLVQFPASIKRSYFSKVRALLGQLTERGADSRHLAVEFRDSSWYHDIVYEMLEEYNASIVEHDMPKSATPLIDMTRRFCYLRFHGEKGDYRGGYSQEHLKELAQYIRERSAEGLPVYAYFNNTIGDAYQNAVELHSYVTGNSL